MLQGIKGMLLGETREIWIHPSLAYGYDTNFEKCIYLRAVVTFTGLIEAENQNSYPSKKYTDLRFLLDPEMESTITETYNSALMEKGFNLSKFLENDISINAFKIIEILENLNRNEIKAIHGFQIDQDLINKILWNIYF